VPEVARRARLGQKMKGIARGYDHGHAQAGNGCVRSPLAGILAALTPGERSRLVRWFPHLRILLDDLEIEPARKAIAISSPFDHLGPVLMIKNGASDLRKQVVGDTGIEPVTPTVSR
jgi:hypothetical protein